MNSLALLALLGDLYSQVATLTEENQRLRELLAAANADKSPATSKGTPDRG